jgi:hypothetical protein
MPPLGLQRSEARVGESLKIQGACRSSSWEVLDVDQKMVATMTWRDHHPREAGTEKAWEIIPTPAR